MVLVSGCEATNLTLEFRRVTAGERTAGERKLGNRKLGGRVLFLGALPFRIQKKLKGHPFLGFLFDTYIYYMYK